MKYLFCSWESYFSFMHLLKNNSYIKKEHNETQYLDEALKPVWKCKSPMSLVLVWLNRMKNTDFQTNEKKPDPDISHNLIILAKFLLLFLWKYVLYTPNTVSPAPPLLSQRGFFSFPPTHITPPWFWQQVNQWEST